MTVVYIRGAPERLAGRLQAEPQSPGSRGGARGGANGGTVRDPRRFILGIITATEAGAVVAGYAFLAAKLYYRNVSWREMAQYCLRQRASSPRRWCSCSR